MVVVIRYLEWVNRQVLKINTRCVKNKKDQIVQLKSFGSKFLGLSVIFEFFDTKRHGGTLERDQKKIFLNGYIVQMKILLNVSYKMKFI